MYLEVISPENKFWEMTRRKNPSKPPKFRGSERADKAREFVHNWHLALLPWAKFIRELPMDKFPALAYQHFKYYYTDPSLTTGRWTEAHEIGLGYHVKPEGHFHHIPHGFNIADDSFEYEPYALAFFAVLQVYQDLGKHRIPQLWIYFPDDEIGMMAKMLSGSAGDWT